MSTRNSSTDSQDYKIIEELAFLLHGDSGKLAFEGRTKLVLTVAAISCINRKVRNLNYDEVVNNDIIVLKPGCPTYSHHDNILFLHQFIRKMPSLKVIPGLRTVQGSVNLTNYSKLTCLELERIPIHLFKGLQLLRSRIKVISCRKCLRLVQELFSSCGGDHAPPMPWLELQSARLSHNDISNLDDSLKLLPMITSLDLSHNNIIDTDGVENLTKLEYLNLNYNCLSQFPCKAISCVYLKVLLLKNNCLESLSGLENLSNLMEVDLSYNCIVDHCHLSVFNKLHKLTKLCLEGNPISYHQEHRVLTIQHLNKKCYSLNFVLDGTNLNKNEFKVVRSCDYCTGDVSLRFIQSQNDETGDCSSISNHGELESSNELVVKNIPTRKRTRKKVTAREAQIDDGIAVDLYSSLSKSVQPSELSDSAHLQTKQEIEMCREMHGKEWLIIGARSSMLSKSIQENDSFVQGTTNDPVPPKLDDRRVPVNTEQRLARVSQVSDDVIILNEEQESFFESYHNTSVLQINVNDGSLGSNQLNEHFSSSEEYEEDDESFQPFIVYSEKPECHEPVIILLVLKNNQLCEKDFITGRTIDRLDVRSLKSIELLESKKMLVDGAECELPRLRITFNHIRKNRRERIYSMEDEKNFKLFYNWINQIADAKTLKQATSGAFQCLKCNSIFSKDMVSKVIENVNQPDDFNILSSSSEAFKDLVRVNACPNCFSKMIIEVDALDQHSLKIEANELNQSTSLSSSFKPSSCKDKSVVSNDSHFSENWLKHSSPKNVPNSNMVAEKFSSSSLKSDKSSCNNFDVQAEVHELPTKLRNSLPDVKPMDLDGNLKRWESDITILSNPSQSSILVLTHQTTADINLDAIPEDSDAKYNSFSKSPEASNRLAKTHSSSDSLTDSACTAIDNHGHLTNTYLGQTPDSYLSALSGAKTIEISSEACKSKHSEKMKFGIDLDVFMKCNTSSAGNRLPLLWSSRDNDVVYSFNDFGRLDHRLKLHLDMHILDNEEEPIVTLRAGVKPYLKDEEFPGFLVMCRSKVYILKITSEKEFSSNWLQKMDGFPTNSLAYLNVHLGGQAFQIEFASAPSPIAYTFLLRDDDHCNNFISFFNERIKACVFEIDRDVFKIDLDSEETLQVIQEQLFTWRNCKESPQEHSSLDLLNNEDTTSNDENVYFYVMCYWLSSENQTSFRPVSIVITRSDIFIFKENLLWPLPHLITPSNELLNRPQIIPQIREKIRDLTSITKIASRTFEVVIKFLDEDTGEELNLRIATETERSLQMLIQALKDPWEKLFEVELQVHQEDS